MSTILRSWYDIARQSAGGRTLRDGLPLRSSPSTSASPLHVHCEPKENSDTEPCAACADLHDAEHDDLSSRHPILVTWRDSAACLNVGPELFFPIGNAYPALLQIEEAKVVCGRCSVVETCLMWAMEARQDSGVWGGLSADERRTLKRRKARATRAVVAG